MTATELLQKLPAAFDKEAAGDVNCRVQFNVSTPTVLTIADGVATVEAGDAADPDVAITAADDDLVALMQGTLDAMGAFMTGKLQVEGDLMLAQQVLRFFDRSKLA